MMLALKIVALVVIVVIVVVAVLAIKFFSDPDSYR